MTDEGKSYSEAAPLERNLNTATPHPSVPYGHRHLPPRGKAFVPPQTARILYTRSPCQKARWSFSFAFALPGRTKPVICAFARRIDISECAFFALLIYQLTIPKKCFVLVLFFHIVCNDPASSKEMFTKLLQILPFRRSGTAVFYAKQRSIHVAQFFGSSLFISSMLSNPAKKQEQYLFVFVLQFCNLHLSFCGSF